MIYPETKYLLINKWSELAETLLKYYNKFVKDKQYRLLYEKLTTEVIDKSKFYYTIENAFLKLLFFPYNIPEIAYW